MTVHVAQPHVLNGGVAAVEVGAYNSSDDGEALFSAVWDMDNNGGQRAPAELKVSVAGVRALFMDPVTSQWKTIVVSDFFHIKSWDVGNGHFGLKVMEQPPGVGQKLVELDFHFLTTEAQKIAGAVRAHIDQLIVAKQTGSGEAIVYWEHYQRVFRAILLDAANTAPFPAATAYPAACLGRCDPAGTRPEQRRVRQE